MSRFVAVRIRTRFSLSRRPMIGRSMLMMGDTGDLVAQFQSWNELTPITTPARPDPVTMSADRTALGCVAIYATFLNELVEMTDNP